jgi:hypothetical protein
MGYSPTISVTDGQKQEKEKEGWRMKVDVVVRFSMLHVVATPTDV